MTDAGIDIGAHRAKTDVLHGTEIQGGIEMKNDDEKHPHQGHPSEPPAPIQNAEGEGDLQGDQASLSDSHQHPAPLGWSHFLGPAQRDASGPRLQISATHRALAFDIIRGCRKALAANDAKKQPCAASKSDYDKKFRRLTEGMEAPGPKPDLEAWTMRLAKYIDAPRSFRAYHAAYCHGLRETIRAGLTVQDRLQRQGNLDSEWLMQVVLLKSLMQILAHVQASTLGSVLWTSKFGARREGTSKKKDLKSVARKQPHWASIMLSAMQGTRYLDAALVSSLAGPRPEELTERKPTRTESLHDLAGPRLEERRKGVVIERDGPETFAIVIGGAKVRDVSGQPWRRLVFSNEVLPAAWKLRLDADDCFVINVPTTKAYSEAMARVSRRVLPGLPVVTPNLFRHAFSDRLRDHAWETEEIAAAMGHSVAETQAMYGGRAGGGRRRTPDDTAPRAVQAARSVRPLDPSGLASFIGGRGARKRKYPGREP